MDRNAMRLKKAFGKAFRNFPSLNIILPDIGKLFSVESEQAKIESGEEKKE